jgi:hypothetical protein
MNVRIMFIVAVLTSAMVGLAVSFGKSDAQTAKDVVGTWTVVSNVTDQGGKKTEPYGANPKGIMVLDANGRYVLTVARPALPKFASNNRTTGTAEENSAVIQGSISHFGTYSVSEADKTINFRIETSTFPNWDGTEQKRSFTLTGDELKYTIATGSGGGTVLVVWKRAK